MRNEVLFKENLLWAIRKCMVSMANTYMILQKGNSIKSMVHIYGSTYPIALKVVVSN